VAGRAQADQGVDLFGVDVLFEHGPGLRGVSFAGLREVIASEGDARESPFDFLMDPLVMRIEPLPLLGVEGDHSFGEELDVRADVDQTIGGYVGCFDGLRDRFVLHDPTTLGLGDGYLVELEEYPSEALGLFEDLCRRVGDPGVGILLLGELYVESGRRRVVLVTLCGELRDDSSAMDITDEAEPDAGKDDDAETDADLGGEDEVGDLGHGRFLGRG